MRISPPRWRQALEEGRAAIRAMRGQPRAARHFANTIEALELADANARPGGGRLLQPRRIGLERGASGVAARVRPKLSAYSSEITNNTALFRRIDDLWQRRDDLGLTEEQMRVLYLTHRSFTPLGCRARGVRAGPADRGEIAPCRAGHGVHAEPAGR